MSVSPDTSSDRRPLRAILPADGAPALVDAARRCPLGVHPKRTLVSAACQACRKRKSKCSGTRPACLECTRRSTDCHWEPTENQAIKRRYHELVDGHHRASSYQRLFESIKHMNTEDAAKTVHRIQAGDDVEALLDEAETTTVRKQDSNAYEDFYRMLQARPEEDFTDVLRLVRKGYDVKTMLRHIREADLLLQIALKPTI